VGAVLELVFECADETAFATRELLQRLDLLRTDVADQPVDQPPLLLLV